MKKLLLPFLSAYLFVACVDKDFDLGKINDSGITFGDEFVAPIGNVEINLKDIFNLSVQTQSNIVDIVLPEVFENTIKMSGGFDEGIADALSDLNSQTIEAEIIHPLPDVKLTLNISFFNGEEEVKVIENKLLASKDSKTTLSVDVTKEMIAKLVSSNSILIKFNVIEGANRKISIDLEDKITINLKLKIKGGLKLN